MGLARTPKVDLRFFLPPPPLPDLEDVCILKKTEVVLDMPTDPLLQLHLTHVMYTRCVNMFLGFVSRRWTQAAARISASV